MKSAWRRYRYVLVATAAGVAALAGSLVLPAAASAQPASTSATPTITLTLSPTTVDYGHQTVIASGTVSTSAGPVSGEAVTISYTNAGDQPASIVTSTDASGSYDTSITGLLAGPQTITASGGGASSTADLGFTKDTVFIYANFAQPDVNAGSTDVLSGSAEYLSGDSAYPLANSTLAITAPGDYPPIPPINTTVTTGADGSFSYTLQPVPDGGGMDFTVSSAPTPYLQAAQVTVPLTINMASSIDLFTGSLTPYHELKFDACAGIGAPLEGGPLIGPLYYQYSKKPSGPWKTLGAATEAPYNNTECTVDQDGDGEYLGHFTAPLASGYYRAYALPVVGQMSSVSTVIHLQRYPTKVTGFAISPRRVKPGGKVTVSGRLLQLTSKWLPDKGATITIEYRYKNKTYTLKHRLTTNSTGQFRGVFEVPRSAAWLAVYGGNPDHFATASTSIRITVR
jgi:hypothetical protein